MNFRRGEDFGDIVLSLATFKTHNNVNTNFKVVLKFEVTKEQLIKIVESTISEYRDLPPFYDY